MAETKQTELPSQEPDVAPQPEELSNPPVKTNFRRGSSDKPVVIKHREYKPPRVRTRTRTVYAVPGAENPENKLGGSWSHKNPECPCGPCRSRRRKAQALALAAGEGWNAVSPEAADALNADLPFRVEESETPRAYVARWLQLKALDSDITLAEAARQIRIGRKLLNSSIQKAVEEGWLKFEDPLAKIEYQIIPKVVRNLNRFLDEGDKTVTIETAKGTLFKQYQESKGITDTHNTILALKFEIPEDGGDVKIIQGHIVGKPKEITSEDA